jgi:uncharacterized membrane protein YphA (DoxX/SURF4 family)
MNLTPTHHKEQKETAVLTTTARVTAQEARRRRLTSTLLWAGQLLMAFFMFNAALPKLTGNHQMVQEFGQIGAGQWLRYLVGTTELAGAIGLLTPWLAGLAAAGLAAEMAGAAIINATVLHNTTYGVNVWMTALLCAVFVLLAYGRRQQIKSLTSVPGRARGNRAPVMQQLPRIAYAFPTPSTDQLPATRPIVNTELVTPWQPRFGTPTFGIESVTVAMGDEELEPETARTRPWS